MSRSRKDNNMLIAMGVLVLFAAYNFLIRPQGAELTSIQDEVATAEQGVSEAQLLLLTPVDTSAPSAVAPDDLTAAVPTDAAVAELLRQLQTIADDTGMAHSSISPAPLELNPNGPGGSLQLDITAAGPHQAALDYVQRLRDLDRLAVVEQIALSVQADGSEQLQISVRVFAQQLPALAAGAP